MNFVMDPVWTNANPPQFASSFKSFPFCLGLWHSLLKKDWLFCRKIPTIWLIVTNRDYRSQRLLMHIFPHTPPTLGHSGHTHSKELLLVISWVLVVVALPNRINKKQTSKHLIWFNLMDELHAMLGNGLVCLYPLIFAVELEFFAGVASLLWWIYFSLRFRLRNKLLCFYDLKF